MRRFLNNWYLVSGWLAAISMVLMTVLVVAQIVGRIVGVVVPSVIQISGFLLAATIFLGLAYTMAAGDHIRVTIALEMAGRRVRLWLEAYFRSPPRSMSAGLSGNMSLILTPRIHGYPG
jgi:TRAP-type C4-dicarboxylate transport system permease small subunit